MKPQTLLSSLLAVTAVPFSALAASHAVNVYIQPVQASPATPALLAQVEYDYDASSPESASEVVSYEAPEMPDNVELVRVGTYDPKSASWLSSTSVVSIENFSKGYAPNIMLSLDTAGHVIAASCQGVQIDAGQTRDFGPQSLLLFPKNGKQPELNKPVALSREGKKVVEEEKTMLQKYWWIIGIAVFVLMTGGGGEEK